MSETNHPKQPLGARITRILLAGFVSLSGILFGYDTGSISGVIATPDFLQVFGKLDEKTGKYSLTTQDKSLLVSILSVGTVVGALAAAPLGDRLGRRLAITVSCLIFLVGIGLQLDTTLAAFLIGRVLAGLGVGLTSVLSPCYQSETAPRTMRGMLVGGYEGFVTIGLLLAAIVNNEVQKYPGHKSWRLAIAVQIIWGVMFGVGIFALPESPRWLVRQGKEEKARRAVAKVLGMDVSDTRVDRELNEITLSLEAEGRAGYATLFHRGKPNKILRRTVTAMCLQGLQQLTGVNFIFYYGTTFFQNSGITDSFTTSVIVNVVNVVCTIPGLWAIDHFGRRTLLFWGAIWMAVAQFIVAIAGVTVSSDNLAGNRVLIAFVCIYIAGFASTWGPCNWTVTGEIFPLRNRAKGMSIATASNWVWNWAIGYMTPYLVDVAPGSAGLQAKVFFLWGSLCIVCAVFTYFFIPETMQLTLEQVDLLWRTSSVRGANTRRKEILRLHPDLGDELVHSHAFEDSKNPEEIGTIEGNGSGSEQEKSNLA